MDNPNIYLAFQKHLSNHPESLALICPPPPSAFIARKTTTLTYAQLDNLINHTAQRCLDQGIKPGDKVLLLIKPSPAFIATPYALFKIGAVPVLIDPGMGFKAFLKCIERIQPDHLIAPQLVLTLSYFIKPKFSSVKASFTPLKASPQYLANAPDCPTHSPQPKDLAAILFTSGSTGPAKGVCYTHSIFANQLQLLSQTYPYTPGSVDLPLLPSFALFAPALGITTNLPPIDPKHPALLDPTLIHKTLSEQKITSSFGSPILWEKIIKYCETFELTLPHLKLLLMAGCPVPSALFNRISKIAPNAEIHSPYGATEALPVSTINHKAIEQILNDAPTQGRGSCVGKPFPNINVKVIEPTNGPIRYWGHVNEMPVNEVGEIIVSGPIVTECYYNHTEATEAAKIHQNETTWHRMGDLGYFDKDGNLWYCGRLKERIYTDGGEILDTDCCEAVINEHPQVYRSALIKVNGKPSIVIEPTPDTPLKPKTAIQSLLEDIKTLAQANPTTTLIEKFYLKKSFPVDVRHNSKIHRHTLAQYFEQQEWKS